MRTRWFLLTLVLLYGIARVAAQTRPTKSGRLNDDYAVPAVTSAFDLIRRPNASSVELKELWALSQLGDAASIATLRIYNKDELITPDIAAVYLIVVRNAFTDKSQILNKADLDPKVTLFILSYLEEKETAEPLLKKRITYVKRCVTDFSCSPQSEDKFLHESPLK
jgi:hypothetical protein